MVRHEAPTSLITFITTLSNGGAGASRNHLTGAKLVPEHRFGMWLPKVARGLQLKNIV